MDDISISNRIRDEIDESCQNLFTAFDQAETAINETREQFDTFLDELISSTVGFFFKVDLENNIVCFTGDGPFEHSDLEGLVINLGAYLDSTDNAWDDIDYIVIGRQNFDRQYLQQALAYEEYFTFISQEDFIGLLLFGKFAPYSKGDIRVLRHAGLGFLTTIGFKWPDINFNSQNDHEFSLSDDLEEISEIKSKYGYHVQAGNTPQNRRTALRSAVKGMGLKKVAYHIAYLIRMNHARSDQRMSKALTKWQSDLEWLKAEYYLKEGGKFTWPRI